MTHYKKTNQLSSEDAAYIAGLIDGEGTITLSHRHSNENRHLMVSVSNTEKPALTFCLEKIGTGKITNKRTAKQHHTPSLTYSCSVLNIPIIYDKLYSTRFQGVNNEFSHHHSAYC
ncbi:MAG: hypothetical protein Q9O24_00485 [Gammaproteobacteria bacterium]|nr:hypothetical protein [Gammaproteobacteria bacterium]